MARQAGVIVVLLGVLGCAPAGAGEDARVVRAQMGETVRLDCPLDDFSGFNVSDWEPQAVALWWKHEVIYDPWNLSDVWDRRELVGVTSRNGRSVVFPYWGRLELALVPPSPPPDPTEAPCDSTTASLPANATVAPASATWTPAPTTEATTPSAGSGTTAAVTSPSAATRAPASNGTYVSRLSVELATIWNGGNFTCYYTNLTDGLRFVFSRENDTGPLRQGVSSLVFRVEPYMNPVIYELDSYTGHLRGGNVHVYCQVKGYPGPNISLWVNYTDPARRFFLTSNSVNAPNTSTHNWTRSDGTRTYILYYEGRWDPVLKHGPVTCVASLNNYTTARNLTVRSPLPWYDEEQTRPPGRVTTERPGDGGDLESTVIQATVITMWFVCSVAVVVTCVRRRCVRLGGQAVCQKKGGYSRLYDVKQYS